MERNRSVILLFLDLIALVLAIIITISIFVSFSSNGLIVLSFGRFILLLVYILTRVLKRMFSKQEDWHDWIYYAGLLALVLPLFLDDLKTSVNYHFWSGLLACTFILSPILGIINYLRYER